MPQNLVAVRAMPIWIRVCNGTRKGPPQRKQAAQERRPVSDGESMPASMSDQLALSASYASSIRVSSSSARSRIPSTAAPLSPPSYPSFANSRVPVSAIPIGPPKGLNVRKRANRVFGAKMLRCQRISDNSGFGPAIPVTSRGKGTYFRLRALRGSPFVMGVCRS